MNLQQLESKVYQLLREPQVLVAGGRPNPPASFAFSLPMLDQDLNDALATLLSRSGYAPAASDKMVVLPIVPGLDYQLPADCGALQRVEYYIGGIGTGQGYLKLDGLSFDDFDRLTSGGISANSTGYPQAYRFPYGPQGAQTIRWYSQPSADNVTAGDEVVLYYASSGGVLAAPNDVPGIPSQYHKAIAYFVLWQYWSVKNDPMQAKMYLAMFDADVKDLKTLADNVNQVAPRSIAGDDDEASYMGLFP